MKNEELSGLAENLHRKYGKAFHNPKEALDALLSIIAINPDIDKTQLINSITTGLGNGKQHVSGSGKREEQPVLGYVRPPRKSRRSSVRGSTFKPFDRVR